MVTTALVVDEYLMKLDLEIADLGAAFNTVTSRLETTYQTLQVLGQQQEKIEDTILEMNQKYEKMGIMMV